MARLTTLIKILIGLTFFVPIIIAPSYLINPYIVPKVLLFRGLVELMLGAYAVLALGNWNRFGIRRSPISIAVGLFTLSLGVSTFVGVDWHRSLFDTYERMLGFDTMAHFVVFYFIATTVVKQWSTWKTLLRLLLVICALVLIVAIAQKFDQVFITGGRGLVSATLGNSSYLGGLGGFTTCLALLLAVRENAKGWRLDYAAAGLVGVIGVIISESRGALLGLVAGFGVLLLAYWVVLERSHKSRRMVGASLGIYVLLALFLSVIGYSGYTAYQLSQTVEKDQASLFMKWVDATDEGAMAQPHDQVAYTTRREDLRLLTDQEIAAPLNNINAYLKAQASALVEFTPQSLRAVKLAHLTNDNRDRPVRIDPTMEHRLARANWIGDLVAHIPGLRRFSGRSLWASWSDRFVVWAAAIGAFKERPVWGWGPNCFSYAFNKFQRPAYGRTEISYDDAHNVFFNTLCEQGLLGIFKLALMATPIGCLWAGYRRGVLDVHLAVVGTAFMTMHTVHNLFVFETPTSYLTLMVMLSLFNSQLIGESQQLAGTLRWRPLAAIMSVAIILVLLWATNLRVAAASHAAVKMRQQAASGDPQQVQDALDRSHTTLRWGPSDLEKKLANAVLTRLAVHAITMQTPESSDQKNPNINTSAIKIAEDENGRRWSQAFRKATALRRKKGLPVKPSSPTFDTQTHKMAILAYDQLGQAADRHRLDIRYPLIRARIAVRLACQFDDASHLKEIEPQLENALKQSPGRQEIQFVLSAVKLRLAKTDQAIALLEAAIDSTPANREGWWRLAEVYTAIGQPEKAQEIARQAAHHGVWLSNLASARER